MQIPAGVNSLGYIRTFLAIISSSRLPEENEYLASLAELFILPETMYYL